MACDSRLLDNDSRARALQTIATNVMDALHVKHQVEIEVNGMDCRQLNFVGKYLSGIEGYKMVDNQSLRKFVFSYLRQDGVFLLRMVAAHAGELPCYELSKALWFQFVDGKEGGKGHDV
uniref:Uncharacterized protein n=1 Tax=Panagrolaimus superbus TaxID=310955 RepID=A0A914YUD5_9BILA